MVEFAPTTIPAGKANVKMAQHGTDDDISIEFYRNPVDGKDHIKFLIPGDKTFQPDYLVTEASDDMYKERFPHQWEAYEAQRDQFQGQTRLEEIAWMDYATRNHFKAHNVFTVEMLAAVSDGNLAKLGPEGRTMRDKAKEMVQEKSKAAAFETVEAEKAELQGKLAQMQEQIDALSQPKRRGRPPKEQSDAA